MAFGLAPATDFPRAHKPTLCYACHAPHFFQWDGKKEPSARLPAPDENHYPNQEKELNCMADARDQPAMLILPVANDYNFINHSLSGFINSMNLLGEHLTDQIDLGQIVLLALGPANERANGRTCSIHEQRHTLQPNGFLTAIYLDLNSFPRHTHRNRPCLAVNC